MIDRSLIATGAIGAALAAICCATPLLAVVLSGIGLTAWCCSLGLPLWALDFTAATSQRRAAHRFERIFAKRFQRRRLD